MKVLKKCIGVFIDIITGLFIILSAAYILPYDGVLKFIYKIPLIGYAASYIMTENRIVICIVLPSLVLLMHIVSYLIDRSKDLSRHRRRIVRRKERRRQRYTKDRITM